MPPALHDVTHGEIEHKHIYSPSLFLSGNPTRFDINIYDCNIQTTLTSSSTILYVKSTADKNACATKCMQVLACSICGAGTYTTDEHDRCVACSAGHDCSDPTLGQVLCADGYYSIAASTACTECPAGSYCFAPSTLPQACDPGTYTTRYEVRKYLAYSWQPV